MSKAKKKNKDNVYRLLSKETGEHYTVRLSKNAYEKISPVAVKKFSKKLRKHTEFKLTKLKKG